MLKFKESKGHVKRNIPEVYCKLLASSSSEVKRSMLNSLIGCLAATDTDISNPIHELSYDVIISIKNKSTNKKQTTISNRNNVKISNKILIDIPLWLTSHLLNQI